MLRDRTLFAEDETLKCKQCGMGLDFLNLFAGERCLNCGTRILHDTEMLTTRSYHILEILYRAEQGCHIKGAKQ